MTEHPWPFSAGFKFVSAKPWADHMHKHVGDRIAMEVKHDGWRVLLVKAPDGSSACYSRGISKVTGTYRDLLTADERQPGGLIPEVAHLLSVMSPGDAVEAELIWPGYAATDVPTALKSHRRSLKVKAFTYAYSDEEKVLTWDHSRDLLKWMASHFNQGKPSYDQSDYLSDFYGYNGPTHYLSIEQLKQYAKACGYEGFMIKLRDSMVMYKMKRNRTVDAVVLGATEGKGKYTGQIGALIVGFVVPDGKGDYEWDGRDIKEVAQVGGMTDDERLWMTEHVEELPGMVCEVKCQASGGKQRLRHPRFIRFREDKPWIECDGRDNT